MPRCCSPVTRSRLHSALACAWWLLGACSTPTSPGLNAPQLHARRSVPLAQVLDVPLTLAADAALVLETQRASGARVQLHLWDPAAGVEVARANAWPYGMRDAR